MIAALVLLCCITAPAEVTVDADSLTLGALIPFEPGDARASIALGFAPQPGSARRFLKQELVGKITASGMAAADIEFPDSVLVRRKARYLDPEMVKFTVQEAFARQYPNAIAVLKAVEVPSTQIGTGAVELTATIPARSDFSGPVYVRLDIRGTGSPKSIFVRTMAEIQQPQLVLKSPIAANNPIGREHVEWRVAPVVGGGVSISMDELEGRAAVRDLREGQVLTSNLLYRPVLVRRGESVTVKASSGGIAIAATMRAKAEGHFGDTITVEHLTGAGSTTARVIGPRTLEALQGAK